MFENTIKIKGKKKGPTSIVLVGVHGDEQCGLKALEIILPNLKIESGVVLFACGNPKAIKVNKRYIKYDLNRMFINKKNSITEKKSYEYKRVQFLKKYLNKADALLDIHASSIPNSKPFAICEPNAKNIIKYLPINLVISGFDKVEPGGTDYYMNNVGKIGICLECGDTNNPKTTNIAKKNILAFLKSRKHIKENATIKKQSYIQIYKKYFTKTTTFKLTKIFKNFEKLQKNQLIGIDGQEKIKAKKQSLILFAHNRNKINSEAFLLGQKKENLV